MAVGMSQSRTNTNALTATTSHSDHHMHKSINTLLPIYTIHFPAIIFVDFHYIVAPHPQTLLCSIRSTWDIWAHVHSQNSLTLGSALVCTIVRNFYMCMTHILSRLQLCHHTHFWPTLLSSFFHHWKIESVIPPKIASIKSTNWLTEKEESYFLTDEEDRDNCLDGTAFKNTTIHQQALYFFVS